MTRFFLPLALVTALAVGPAAAQPVAQADASLRPAAGSASPRTAADVTTARIVAAPDAEPENWLTYYGGYNGQSFSRLDQVNASNVARLAVAWDKTWPFGAKFEATPLVADGMMYVTTGGETSIYALDAATGQERWHYTPDVDVAIPLCCGHVNRGAALGAGKVYFVTLDAMLYALDAQTGALAWKASLGDPKDGYSATLAPLFVKDKVVIGISGGEYGIRGYIDAYDAATGARAWRFYTVPAPGEPGSNSWETEAWKTGGGPAWNTGTYDPEQDLIFWGIGNPAPDLNGRTRPGDNLYTDSAVALDPDDGSLRWHYQYTPHDVWDYDDIQVHTLVDVAIKGVPRRAVLHASKNGFFYALDRTTGQFIYATPFARQTWVTSLDTQTGRPVVNEAALPEAGMKPVCPSVKGATEWTHLAYSPETQMAYVPVIEQCAQYRESQAFYEPGMPFWGGTEQMDAFGPAESHGSLTAIDVTTGAIKWRVDSKMPVIANVMATAGGLVFWREQDGLFHATDAATGKDLWTDQGGGGTPGSVITYRVAGKQYVAWTAVQPETPHHARLVVYALP